MQGNPAPIAQTSAEEWQGVLATNLTGVFNTVRAAVPHLIDGGATAGWRDDAESDRIVALYS